MNKPKQHLLSVLVENEPGALARVTGLFSGRGFNIQTLNVASTQDASLSHITITTEGDAKVLEQIVKQLRKLLPVNRVVDLTHQRKVERELALFKIQVEKKNRLEILQAVSAFRCEILEAGRDYLTIQSTGDAGSIDALMEFLQGHDPNLKVTRTGVLALAGEAYSVQE